MGSTTVHAVRPALSGFRALLRRKIAGVGAALFRTDPVVLALLLVIAVVTVAAHTAYRENLRARFANVYHDRNSHYQAGVNVACELRQGHLIRAVLDLDAASMVWPALHPILLAGVLTVTGPSPAAAVLPSLLGWAGATLFAFLIVRRLGGTYAVFGGFVAAALFLGSPALQALGTDVMLESLGLCLTLAAVYAYLRLVANPTPGTGLWLGLALSLLFLHKYNYWVLVVVALGASDLSRRPGEWFRFSMLALRMVDWSAWVSAQFRRPLNYPIALLLGVSLVAVLNQGVRIGIGDAGVTIRDTRLLVSVAYTLFVVRLMFWWPTARTVLANLVGDAGVAFVKWAALPPMLWLLLPFRLKTFFWFSSAANTAPGVSQTPAEGLRYYLDGFSGEYHTVPELAWVAAGLAIVGMLALLWRGGTGRFVVPVAFALSGTLAVMHPNHQLRFLHTWAPLLWVLTGLGVAAVLDVLARIGGNRLARAAGMATVAVLAGVLVQLTPAFARVGPGLGAGYDPRAASLRDLYDVYLPLIDGDQPTGLFTNLPDASWRWAFEEKFGHKNGLKHNMREAGAFDPVTAPGVVKWLAATDCRVIVYLDIPHASPLFEGIPTQADNAAILGTLKTQSDFQLAHRVRVKNLGTVCVWKR